MMQPTHEDFGGVIRAAGGLVWCESSDGGKRLALVPRKRHAGEGWTLPKGKLDPEKGNTTWEEAARREVVEKIGLAVEVTSFAGCNSYVVKEERKPTIVLYWNMK